MDTPDRPKYIIIREETEREYNKQVGIARRKGYKTATIHTDKSEVWAAIMVHVGRPSATTR